MMFDIRRVKNGFILKVTSLAEEIGEAEEIVFQEKYDEEDDIECFADFLRILDSEYGPTTSRYSPKRIYVRIEPGDKYEEPEKGKN